MIRTSKTNNVIQYETKTVGHLRYVYVKAGGKLLLHSGQYPVKVTEFIEHCEPIVLKYDLVINDAINGREFRQETAKEMFEELYLALRKARLK